METIHIGYIRASSPRLHNLHSIAVLLHEMKFEVLDSLNAAFYVAI
jgi:hypothetical protein